MAQYVDKSVVVAGIKRRMDENRGKQTLPQYFGMVEEDLNILSFIDTLEVKEAITETPDNRWLSKRSDENDIEYTRTDAFIEKAMKFLKEWDAYRVCLEGHKDWFIEQFKNYMKGE